MTDDPAIISLFGTMATDWRVAAKARLIEMGYEPTDNTDERWPTAETAEQILPLLRQDHEIMLDCDLILWHHDSGTPGNTARFELPMPLFLQRQTIVHVEPGVVSREYMHALCNLYPQCFHWAETLEDAYRMIPDILASRQR